MINRGEFTPPVLIFVQSKERAYELVDELKKSFVNTEIKIDSINAVYFIFQITFLDCSDKKNTSFFH
jgi:hypothetical protein